MNSLVEFINLVILFLINLEYLFNLITGEHTWSLNFLNIKKLPLK